MITFIQRTGSALNINVHLRILAIDGVYKHPSNAKAKPQVHPARPAPR